MPAADYSLTPNHPKERTLTTIAIPLPLPLQRPPGPHITSQYTLQVCMHACTHHEAQEGVRAWKASSKERVRWQPPISAAIVPDSGTTPAATAASRTSTAACMSPVATNASIILFAHFTLGTTPSCTQSAIFTHHLVVVPVQCGPASSSALQLGTLILTHS